MPQEDTHDPLGRGSGDSWEVRLAAVQAVAAGWAENSQTLPWLRDRGSTDNGVGVRRAAVQAVAAGRAEDPQTLPWLRDRASADLYPEVRRAAAEVINYVENLR